MPKLELSEEEQKSRKARRAEWRRLYRAKHIEKERETRRLWGLKNRERIRKQAADYRLKKGEAYWREKGKQAYQRRKERGYYKEKNEKRRNNVDGFRDKLLATAKKGYIKLRMEILQHYSGGSPQCACCGEANVPFLTIDHITGGGVKQRKALHVSSVAGFYTWLRKNGYPEGYQVLCFNCNGAKSGSGKRFCPVHHPEEYA